MKEDDSVEERLARLAIKSEPEPESPVDAVKIPCWPGGVERKWAEKNDADTSGESGAKPCRYGIHCFREGCWFTHPTGRALSRLATSHSDAHSFSVLTWNFQAANTRGPEFDAADRSGAETCLRQVLTDPRLRCLRSQHPADILSLQELQRCPRQVAQGDCIHCDRGTCHHDHAGWVAAELEQHGYDGAIHEHGMTNTVGLFWRREAFEPHVREVRRASSERGTVFFCDFNRPESVGGIKSGAKVTKKGAVLALLRHRATGQNLLVVGAHLSVPLSFGGEQSPEVPLAEMMQLMKKVDSVYDWNAALGSFPWLLVGDLNSVPQAATGCADPLVYKFLTGSACGLRSAYRTVLGREPPLTSVEPDFRHTIDYIFTSRELRAKAVLDVTIGDNAEAVSPWPSDHLALVAEIMLPGPRPASGY